MNDKNRYSFLYLAFHKENDKDIIETLDEQENKQGFIKTLIRNHMKLKEDKKMQITLNDADECVRSVASDFATRSSTLIDQGTTDSGLYDIVIKGDFDIEFHNNVFKISKHGEWFLFGLDDVFQVKIV